MVQELVHLQHRPLLVWPIRVDRREQPCARFTLKFDDDAAKVGGCRNSQEHFALDEVEIGVVLVRVFKRQGDEHCGGCFGGVRKMGYG